ncbi:MAG: transglutaminase-like cysteine peptidase [Paracoccaceae bacterium]
MLVTATFSTGTALADISKSTAFINPRKVVAAPMGARNMCETYRWACAQPSRNAAFTKDHLKIARSINRQVNRNVRSIADSRQYRKEEVWALPTRRGGDCEDFALLKKRLLIQAGIPPERLLVATVLDRRRNSHAVLVLRTETGDYVLDNLTNRMLHWKKTRYTFLRMQDPKSPNLWVAVLAGGILDRRA